MVVEFKDWLVAILGPEYSPWIGPWVDTPGNKDKFLVALRQDAGPEIVISLQRPNYQVFLLGPQNGREHQQKIMQDAQTLINAAIERAIIPCGAAHVRALGAAMGPGLTEEERPWAQVNFQVTI